MPNIQVYCTNCQYFMVLNEGIPYCRHEDTCNLNNCEDSMTLSDRPKYWPSKIKSIKKGSVVCG